MIFKIVQGIIFVIPRFDFKLFAGVGNDFNNCIKIIPEKWSQPVIDSVVLPAHADGSPNSPV